MTVEVATLISDLNASYPAASDFIYEGDDHLRLLKSTVKATFPNVSGIVTATHTQLNRAGSAGTWTLQATTTNSGTPNTIDFVNGTGGVVMDSNYDAHLLDFTGFNPSTNAQLYLQASTDTGSTWTVFGANVIAQALTISAGTVAGAVVTTSNLFKISGGKNVLTGGAANAAGQVLLCQNTTQGALFLRSHLMHGAAAAEEFAEVLGKTTFAAAFQTAINGLRLTWSGGTFATPSNGGQVRLYSRRCT